MTVTADIQADMQAVMLHYARPPAVVRIGVTRVGPSSQAAAVRGWDDQQVSAANVLIRDFEAPIGVPVTYTIDARDADGHPAGPVVNLVTNPSLEVGLAGWVADGTYYINIPTSFTRVTTQAQIGSASAEVVTSATPGQQGARFAFDPAVVFLAGVTYYFSVFVRANAAGSVALFIGAGAAEAGVPVRAFTVDTTWKRCEVSWTPTANRTSVSVGVKSPTAGAAMTFQIDGAQVTTTPSAPYADGATPGHAWTGAANASTTMMIGETVTVTVPSGGCSDTWINDLARVSNTQRVVLEAFPELDFPVPASVHDVIGRRAPITSSDIAHTPSFDFSFLTESLDDRDRARAALGNGVPVLLRTPPEDGIGNLYLSVLAYKEQRIVGLATTADRRFVVTGRQVDRPDPELYRPVGLVDYLYVRTTFATYQALKDQRATYDAVLYDWTGKQPIDVVPWPPDDV